MTFPEMPKDNRIALNLRPPIKAGPEPDAWQKVLPTDEGALRPWSLCFGKDADGPELIRVTGLEDPMSFFDPTVAARSRAVVAMRFHAVLFAIQSGTPVVPIANARKLDEFCEPLGIPQMPVEDPGEPLEEWVRRARESQSPEFLREITATLSGEAWEAATDMRERIEAAADRTRRCRQRLRYRLGTRWRRLCNGGQ